MDSSFWIFLFPLVPLFGISWIALSLRMKLDQARERVTKVEFLNQGLRSEVGSKKAVIEARSRDLALAREERDEAIKELQAVSMSEAACQDRIKDLTEEVVSLNNILKEREDQSLNSKAAVTGQLNRLEDSCRKLRSYLGDLP